MPFVYILECSDGTFYTGSAKDLDNRIQTHQAGKGAKYTRGRLPVRLVYFKEFNSMNDAYKREIEIKKLPREKKMELFEKDK